MTPHTYVEMKSLLDCSLFLNLFGVVMQSAVNQDLKYFMQGRMPVGQQSPTLIFSPVFEHQTLQN
jgi:hypothetical protein